MLVQALVRWKMKELFLHILNGLFGKCRAGQGTSRAFAIIRQCSFLLARVAHGLATFDRAVRLS